MGIYDELCYRTYAGVRALILPNLTNSQEAYLDALRAALCGGGRWLDLGCGHGFVPKWIPRRVRHLDLRRWQVVGIDLDFSSLSQHPDLRSRVHGNIEQLPFADAAFSLVTANMVVEHVREPRALFAEIGRVLAPGGVLLLHTPNASGYTTVLARLIPQRLIGAAASLLLGRDPEDVYPTYYLANSASDLASLGEEASLHLTSVDHVLSSPQLIRLPPLMVAEMMWLRLLRTPYGERRRPCLLARFERVSGDGA